MLLFKLFALYFLYLIFKSKDIHMKIKGKCFQESHLLPLNMIQMLIHSFLVGRWEAWLWNLMRASAALKPPAFSWQAVSNSCLTAWLSFTIKLSRRQTRISMVTSCPELAGLLQEQTFFQCVYDNILAVVTIERVYINTVVFFHWQSDSLWKSGYCPTLICIMHCFHWSPQPCKNHTLILRNWDRENNGSLSISFKIVLNIDVGSVTQWVHCSCIARVSISGLNL